MRFRTPPRERASADARGTDSETASSTDGTGAGVVRKLLLLAIGFVAVRYVLRRYGRLFDAAPSMDDVQTVQEQVPSADELREQTAEAVPGEFQEIPIGGRERDTDDGGDAETAGADAAEDIAEDTAEGSDDAETNVDMTDADRSPEVISEQADETVPEPGEMAVDDEVADELIDDVSESDDDEESGDED